MKPSPKSETPSYVSPGERRFLRGFVIFIGFILIAAGAVAGVATHNFRTWLAVVAGTIAAALVLMLLQGTKPLPGNDAEGSVGRGSWWQALVAGASGGFVAGLILPTRPLLAATLSGVFLLFAWRLRDKFGSGESTPAA